MSGAILETRVQSRPAIVSLKFAASDVAALALGAPTTARDPGTTSVDSGAMRTAIIADSFDAASNTGNATSASSARLNLRLDVSVQSGAGRFLGRVQAPSGHTENGLRTRVKCGLSHDAENPVLVGLF